MKAWTANRSCTSRSETLTTRKPRLGSQRTEPSLCRIIRASRTGVALTFSSAARLSVRRNFPAGNWPTMMPSRT
jgi:hypothetical protein